EGAALPGGSARPSLHPETMYREIARGREAIAAGVTTDGYPQHFKRSLDGVMELYGVGLGPGQHRRVLAVFAVPGRNLVPHARPDGGPGLLYPIAIRLIAMDRASGVVRQLDTVRTFLTRDTLRGEQHLTGWLELPVPAGIYDVRALLTSPGVDAGSGAGRDSVALAARSDSLTLSDIILGREGQLSWRYDGAPVPLNPLNAYPRGGTATLFYELAGLQPGRHYRVAFAIRRPEDKPDQRPQVSVAFDVTARADYQPERREIGLENLKPGAYLLQTTVAAADGGPTIVRTRALNVLDH
ncbi:MAG TPA: hypothetical protein VNH46_10195, partial [Gemmatimonadales bacterium]|nr:hypothetical protein [Gemmatimonadales bacterium]